MRRYHHEGRTVSAMRFVGNGPEIAAWAGSNDAEAEGDGLSGRLLIWTRAGMKAVESGDWVIRDGQWLTIVPQELFDTRYRRIEHANVE